MVYCVPRPARACTVRSCVTHEGFSFACKSTKTRVPGCVHANHLFLLASTVRAQVSSLNQAVPYIIAVQHSAIDCSKLEHVLAAVVYE